MARNEAPPFPRGETFYNGSSIDTNDLGGPNLLGKTFLFEPNSPIGQQTGDPTGRFVLAKCVRNTSGVNLKPGRLVRYEAADPYESTVDGYCYAVEDRPAGIVDDLLPAAGVVPNDVFWLIVDGPTKGVQLSSASSVLSIGDRLVPGTGTSATNNDAGRIVKQDLTGATSSLGNNVQNCFGYAAEANNSVEDAVIKIIVHLPGK